MKERPNATRSAPSAKAWAAKGSFSGLRARGGHTLDCEWQDGKVTSYVIRAAKPAKVKVRVNGELKEVTATAS